MSMLPGTRRRTEEFARVLDGHAQPGEYSLLPLVGLARALQTLPLGPAPSARDAFRARLIAVAAVQAAAPPAAAPVSERIRVATQSYRGQRRMAVAAGAVAGVVAIAGVGVAGSRSLPGDPAYGVKRAAEGVQLWLAHGDVAKGRRHLEFAATRLREVSALIGHPEALAVASGEPDAAALAWGGSTVNRVDATLGAMDSDTRAGSQELTHAFAVHQDRAALELLSSFAHAQHARLAQILPELPPASLLAGFTALTLVNEVGRRATALLTFGVCTSHCRPPAAGPTPLTASPSAAPTSDVIGVTPCTCASSSGPVPGAGGTTPSPTPGATSTPTPAPTPTGSPSSSPSPSPSPTGPLPSLPSIPPLPTPSLPVPTPSLPAPLPTSLFPGLNAVTGAATTVTVIDATAPVVPGLRRTTPRPAPAVHLPQIDALPVTG
ncbi:MAG TPA: DUF5667 domain-containing protein [Mycobacteriales bacterium]|nr:DUF5667 domain-containing protein [Mycobacteriales bacterium]